MLHNCTTYKSGRYVDRLQHVVKTSFSCGFAELAGLKFLANILFWEFEYLQSLLQHASEDLYGMQGQDLWWLQYIFYSGAVNEAANVAGCNSKRHSLISFSLKWPHARILHTWYSQKILPVAVTAAGSLHRPALCCCTLCLFHRIAARTLILVAAAASQLVILLKVWEENCPQE